VFGCGNGVINPNEACDDGNTVSTDGCTDTCTITPGYSCPTPNQPCVGSPTGGTGVTLLICGNSLTEVNENCDDGN